MRNCRGLLLVLGAVALSAVLPVWGCKTSQQGEARACSSDAECDPGTVCRVARCRKACAKGRWVGESVKVKCEQGVRTATVSGCDGVPPPAPSTSASATAEARKDGPPKKPVRLWVRYESGIEEQVSISRVKPVLAAQASAK